MTNELTLNASQYGLESSKAEMLEATFSPMVAKFKELESAYSEVMQKEIDEKTCLEAKRVRLLYVKVRTGTDDLHKKVKEDLLIQTRAIDGIRNVVKFACTGHEESLEKVEKHFERLEAERKQKLKESREGALAPFNVETQYIDLANMSFEVWENYFAGVKSAYEQRIAAERIADEQRVAREKAEAEEREKQRLENIRLKAEAEAREKEIQAEREKQEVERKKLEEKARKEREAKEAEIRKEREVREKLEAELRAKQEAERQAQLKAKIEADRIEAEKRKAEKAPKKQKMKTWVESLSITIPAGLENDATAKEIAEKFESFRSWAKSKIEAI